MSGDLQAELDAIEGSFGTLAGDQVDFSREPDARWAYLDELASR